MSPYEFARREIKQFFGDDVVINRKSLHKYGLNESVATSEEDITPEVMPGTETFLTSNGK